MAILEAMALGRPVVATAAGGVPGIVKDGETGILVEPEEPKALAAGIEKLLTDPVLAERWRRQPRTWWRRSTGSSQWSAPPRTCIGRCSVSDTITTRILDDSDVPPVLDLLRAALGEPPLLRRTPELFAWKHFDNPFGRSMALLAEADDRIVGLRAFCDGTSSRPTV